MSIPPGYGRIILHGPAGGRKRGRGYGLGTTSSAASAQRLELNFALVLFSARLGIQLLEGWVDVLEQNRLGLM